jgi:hypothetical protein
VQGMGQYVNRCLVPRNQLAVHPNQFGRVHGIEIAPRGIGSVDVSPMGSGSNHSWLPRWHFIAPVSICNCRW